jgi:hypothetical protein
VSTSKEKETKHIQTKYENMNNNNTITTNQKLSLRSETNKIYTFTMKNNYSNDWKNHG